LNPCVERMLEIVKQSGAPLFMEVVKSIASICGVDPYELWSELAKRFGVPTHSAARTSAAAEAKRATAPSMCWRCPACGREFESPAKLVSHILYFVRQRERSHVQLYREIKKLVEERGKTFTEIVKEEYRC